MNDRVLPGQLEREPFDDADVGARVEIDAALAEIVQEMIARDLRLQ